MTANRRDKEIMENMAKEDPVLIDEVDEKLD